MWTPFLRLRVSGHSMEPTFRAGERVLVNRLSFLFKRPRKGNVIAFTAPDTEKIFIKRVQEVRETGVVCIGDNAADSLDSRKSGVVPFGRILGRVWFRY